MASSGMLRRVAFVRTDLVFLRSVRRLLVAASVVPSSPILVTLMKEAQSSSETSVLTRATRRNVSEDTIFHSHRRENLKSYILTSHQCDFPVIIVFTVSEVFCYYSVPVGGFYCVVEIGLGLIPV
jgi:hypothetical protein